VNGVIILCILILIVQYSRKQHKDDKGNNAEEDIITISTEKQIELRSRISQNSHGVSSKRYVSIVILSSLSSTDSGPDWTIKVSSSAVTLRLFLLHLFDYNISETQSASCPVCIIGTSSGSKASCIIKAIICKLILLIF
jgi:hypothetical protein